MGSDNEVHNEPADRAVTMYALVCGVAVLFVCIFAALAVWWFAVGSSQSTPAIPPVVDTIPTTEPDETANKALIVLDGATQLRRDPGAYWSFHVAYSLTEKHPASNAIQQISSRLKALGWTPLQEDWLNPGLPSSHVRGWTDFRDSTTTTTQHVHQWGAQWQDKSGSIVGYTLRYSYPDSGTPDFQSLWINGSWYPAAGVKIMKAATHQ